MREFVNVLMGECLNVSVFERQRSLGSAAEGLNHRGKSTNFFRIKWYSALLLC